MLLTDYERNRKKMIDGCQNERRLTQIEAEISDVISHYDDYQDAADYLRAIKQIYDDN